MKSQKGVSLIVLIVIIVLAIFALIMIFGESSNNKTNTKSKTYGLGDTITFDGLELTFDSSYSFDVVASTIVTDYNGDYIKLGVNIKNVSNEKNSLSVLDYQFFGSQGTQLTGVAGYFDDSIEHLGDLKSGASKKLYFYIPYDGNGSYSIDFNNLSVEFNVTK